MRATAMCWLVALVLLPLAQAAAARDLAILLINERYESHPNLPATGSLLGLDDALRRAGFEVIVVRDIRSDGLVNALPAPWRRLAPQDRLLIVVAGHVVRSSYDAWLLAADARTPDVFSVGAQGLSLGALMQIGADRPGRAVLAVARHPDPIETGYGLRSGGWVETPQGVTVLDGAPGAVADFIAQELLVPGRLVPDAARAARGVAVRGFQSRSEPFQPARRQPDAAADREAWERAAGGDSIASYELYLRQFPGGRFAGQARERILELRLTPEDRARLDEEGLNLSRDQRRQIQSDLAILGFDPRGIDGIFGPGTRAAIADWQGSVGIPAVGYLTANQIARLDSQADERRRALDAEAERRRAKLEKRDRDFWEDTGVSGREADLRAYLARHPDGLFAETAREQLADIERRKRRQAQAADREAWNQATQTGTLEAYRDYIRENPDGAFIEEAKAKIRELTEPAISREDLERARRQEAALNLSPVARRLIETRLRQLGYDPGDVDGEFDRAARRAIRRYQADNALPVTGYINQLTVVRLVVSLDQ